jgi:predicted deacylase
MTPEVVRRTLSLGGNDVPVIELTGAGDGPRLTVIAGVHGCEYASMAGVRQWARALAGRDLRGSVRAVPVLNQSSFWGRTPFVVPEDGKNLNRCFPGNPAGTAAERLAHDAFTQLIVGSDAYVDAHAGDMVEALEPFALYDAGAGEARAAEMATAYGLGYVIRQEPGPDRPISGTSTSAAAAIGIPAITAESGQCGLVEPAAVDRHVRGLDRVLALLGMAEDPAAGAGPAPAPTYLQRFLWLYTTSPGGWEPAVRPGEQVTEGQLLGTVSSLDGAEVLHVLTAPSAGVAMFITSSPAVAAEGLLLGLGATSTFAPAHDALSRQPNSIKLLPGLPYLTPQAGPPFG